MKQMEHSLAIAQGNPIYGEYKRNLKHHELPQNIAAFYQSDLLDEMKPYVNNNELTTTEVYGILNLALKKLSEHSMVYVWENKDGVPMVATTSATFPFTYYLSMVSCMFFYSISRYIVLSVILTAVSITVVNAGKGYFKHRRAYKDKIDCFAFSILTWLRYPQQFNEERTCIIYPPFRHFDCIPVDILKAALMCFDGRCSAKDWD
ncbi:hypothetical protein RMCBS344292_14040 [Rhizopus microsporus]|nr:hypothetical protein RMCBS344292_14040 [Rhizopus microsporus]